MIKNGGLVVTKEWRRAVKRLLLITTAVLLWPLAIFAGASTVTSVVRQSNEVVLTLDSGRLEIRPLADDAIRVRFTHGNASEKPSFVLTGKAALPEFTIRESAATVTVATAKMQTEIDRMTGVVRFLNASGNVFLSEKVGTRSLKPNLAQGRSDYVVEQGFESPADEHQFGMGQYQDGVWDWRGIPLELRQLNTQIAIPMLISNKGYGLLWENASRTDFNLPGVEIALTSDGKPVGTQGPTATEQLSKSGPTVADADRHGRFTTGAAEKLRFQRIRCAS
jgi:alpha-D-xyloside xylohydrolase